MKKFTYLLLGLFFGIAMFKSGASSWFRIFEMFQFDSFHMYGIIGSALVLGVIAVQYIKRNRVRDVSGNPIVFQDKKKGIVRYMAGGTIFGLGWALGGACPGPMFALLGAGFLPLAVAIIGALLGTWIYGLIQNKLPH
ncbi:DUF6691 family protein [Flavobacterium sp. JP2137]|uniref:DUF6691 family protein n=1 Tax=Flavobacterium sp. JP2137 TaxID=3414510 RepID=UPI003D2FF318